MKFKISKSISNAAWGGVDKSRIWQMLKKGLEDGAEGVAEAVREVYAVAKAQVGKDLNEADCKMPHHEVSEDGTITLNRAGVIAAAAALAGARSEPKLTNEQIAEARRHLLRHYRELNLAAPEGLAGEMSHFQALLTGEMQVEDVPLAPWVDLQALKSDDPDPLQVVVEVPAGKSKRGWNYKPSALQRIVGEVMSRGLAGFLGHQKPEDVDHEFPTPVTHWIGAKWENGRAYFRGIIDKAAPDLKRWIRSKVIREVSIFGAPKLQTVAGETQVVDYHPLSIDWTPLGRPGMPTSIVAVGEMDEIISDGGGQTVMTWKELVAQLKAMLTSKEVTLAQVAGEMGWNAQALAGDLDASWVKKITDGLKTLEDVRTTLGVTGEMDILAVAKSAKEALDEKAKTAHKVLVEKAVKDKVTGEMGQNLVLKMLQVPESATEQQIAGEIDKVLADPVVKEAFSKMHVDTPAGAAGAGAGDKKTPEGLKVKRVAI